MEALISSKEAPSSRDSLRELLCLRRGSTHVVNNHIELFTIIQVGHGSCRTCASAKEHTGLVLLTSMGEEGIATLSVELTEPVGVWAQQLAYFKFEFHF